MLRPTGIGILIGGAWPGWWRRFPPSRAPSRVCPRPRSCAREGGQKSEELSPKVLVGGLIASVLALMAVTIVASIDNHGGFHIGTAVTAAVAGAIWIALAGLIVAQATGATDISPLTGLALIAVTLMLAITGGNVVVAVTIGIAVCIATNQCADMMTDLKTGHLIGGVPRRQQLAQFAVAWVGPAIAIGTTILLWKSGTGGTNGFGPESAACVQQASGLLARAPGQRAAGHDPGRAVGPGAGRQIRGGRLRSAPGCRCFPSAAWACSSAWPCICPSTSPWATASAA